MRGGTDTVLVVDDEVDLLENCRRILLRAGFGCCVAENGTEGLKVLQKESPALAFIDLRMPDMDGLELLGRIRKLSPRTAVVLITGYASVQTAVEAMAVGAFDYLPKPFNAERLLDTVTRALEFSRQQAREGTPQEASLDRGQMVGESPEIRDVLETVARVARSEANVLICGETGSGKELVARMLHRNSPRSAMPFVPLDCVSLADSLLESELFGHERGAYTDAKEQSPGLLETANGGVLFLDEIAELGLPTQAKLLRALQEQEVRRVGGRKPIPINIRVISATNKNLAELIREGKFREDLHYRLNVVIIRVPPLRERKGDTRLLANHFFATFNQRQSNRELRGVSEAALMILEQYPWPGNVRELRNVMERAESLSRGSYVAPTDLPEELLAPVAADRRSVGKFQSRKRDMIQHFERHYVRELMARTNGNVTRAAELAGMLRPALQRLLRRHSIDPAHFR